ncbi:MAG: leucyl aminopeptidase [Aquificae bacterium]|nr:leucyl aminopeptidase [Aquificota bacterium]
MEIKATSGKLGNLRTKAVVSFMFKEDRKFNDEIQELDKLLNGGISLLKKEQRFSADEGKFLVVPTFRKLKTEYIIIVGLGSKKKADLDTIRRAGAYIIRKSKELRIDKIAIDIKNLEALKEKEEELAQAFSEGVILGGYQFDKYKKNKDKFKVKEIDIRVSRRFKSPTEKKIKIGKILAQAQNFARDIANEPGNVITPQKLAQIAEDLAKEYGFEVKIYDEKKIEKLGMNAFLAVAKGSENPPRFIHLIYKAKKPKKEIALVGKGLTFDSGGLNIKPGDFMRWMKSDKSGACAVLGIFKALGELKPDIVVHGVIAACENMPDGKAYRPDDILIAKNGVSIEVGNTDAEGRLTLADALSYVSELKPDTIIDMATLTGACVVALGEYTAGVMGNNQKLIDEILDTSEKTGEWMWQLPFNDKLREHIKAPNADVLNIGKTRYGGAITAGLFLEKFVDPKIPWAHIDIAGPAHNTSGWYYHPPGATGFPVRTITSFILENSQE